MRIQCKICGEEYERSVTEEEFKRNGGKFYCKTCKRIAPFEEKK